MFKEFREFAVKGNMIELAVGVVIGAAFTSIVSSFVKDLMTPIIGLFGRADFSKWFLVLRHSDDKPGPWKTIEDAAKDGAITFNYGAFLTAVINFLIVAFAVFLLVKAINKLRREPEPADAEPPAPSEEVKILTEIRDELKKR